MKKNFLVAAVISALAFPLVADDSMTVPVNGAFCGFSFGVAPGWHENDGDGDAYVREGRRQHRELHIESPADGVQSVSSDAFAVKGKILIVEMEFKGRGKAALGIETFDAQEQTVAGDETSICSLRTGHGRIDAKYYFKMPENATTAKIVLSTFGDAEVIFGDLEARFTNEITPEILAALQPRKMEPEKVSSFDKMQRPTDSVQPTLIDDGATLDAEELFNGDAYQITLPVGGEMEFRLEEDADDALLWELGSVDGEKYRAKIAHDNVGLWPFDRDIAKISLKAKNFGVSQIVLKYGDKELKIKLNIL